MSMHDMIFKVVVSVDLIYGVNRAILQSSQSVKSSI
jgi:hypothetical protein